MTILKATVAAMALVLMVFGGVKVWEAGRELRYDLTFLRYSRIQFLQAREAAAAKAKAATPPASAPVVP